MPSPEILVVLSDELSDSSPVFQTALSEIVSGDENAFQEGVETYHEQLQRISDVTGLLNLAGLQWVCRHIETNLSVLSPQNIGSTNLDLFAQWPDLMLDYLATPKDKARCRALAQHCFHAEWPMAPESELASSLEQKLLDISEEPEDIEQTESRQIEATMEDIALQLEDDINKELVEAFLTEGPLQAMHYSSMIQGIENGRAGVEAIDEARRVIHALKGEANTVGVRGVASLSHHVEDILQYLRDNGMLPKGSINRLLLDVADCLEMMFEALLGTGSPPEHALSVLQQVLDVANAIDKGEFEKEYSFVSSMSATQESPAEDSHNPSAQFQPLSTPQVDAKVRVSAESVEEMQRLSGEMAISRGHVQERLQQSLSVLRELVERHNILWHRANDLERLVSTQGVAAGQREIESRVGVVNSGFDPLEMDQYSELHSGVHTVIETIADLQMLGIQVLDNLSEIGTTVNQQALINNELHDQLMTARMVPASTLNTRLQRAVRKATDSLHKPVQLNIHGQNVMLDDQMVNLIIDPLQHILRNAVDHGLESPEERVHLGKAETGTIDLSFARDGNFLVIKCQDDGAGLDLPFIRSKAIERGLVSPDQELSDEETMRLILQAGFSTSETVTEISGRGVGMDIVNNTITKMKGSIDIRTESGKGCTFILRAPLSMGIAHCLLADVGQKTFALPTDNLDRIVFQGAKKIQKIGTGYAFRDGKETCPARLLSDLLLGVGHGAQGLALDDDERPVILVKTLEGKEALVVDKVVSGRDLVIKGLGKYMRNINGVSGASILGDGRVVPILDMLDLLEEKSIGQSTVSRAQTDQPSFERKTSDILIVDDSLSVRTALSQLVHDDGFDVRTAIDGMEAIEQINRKVPDVLLVDMEMPRMNGLELTARLRSQQSTRQIPVIMITSRSSEKHRVQAEAAGVDVYLTKPYHESDLLSRLSSVVSRAA
ncbi:MAG: response regulator [Gammaproteobacteria bacterium]|nr:response regulator [Gammaproteobacteria bacterium]MDH5801618.1 response regulator [Gammaproteobacteria bacterium]